MASIVDRLRAISEKVGGRTTGSTVQDVISDIEAALSNTERTVNKPQQKAKKPDRDTFFTDEKTPDGN